MTTINAITPLAAFATGIASSPHCVAMCGPLACALRARPLEYHGGRLISYSIAGVLSGAAGQAVLSWLKVDARNFLPWILIAILLAIGAGLDRRLPQVPLVAKWLIRVRLNRSLGLLTPLLPCGPLWMMLGAAAATGKWSTGAILMFSFAAGAVPLPLLVHTNAALIRSRLSPAALRWSQQGIALLGAVVLAWRISPFGHGCCH
jgi:sulfite exporter TauE/SafE